MNREAFFPTSFLNSYTPLLYRAIIETDGPIVECGMGNFSTTLLHNTDRYVVSYDTSLEWLSKFNVENKYLIHPSEWTSLMKFSKPFVSVIFIDQAPGEVRERCIAELTTGFDGIIVAHDTEPAADYGYKMRQHFSKFKYMVEVKTESAWATALSNTIDVTQWSGESFGIYIID
jgi:hypothetical protein